VISPFYDVCSSFYPSPLTAGLWINYTLSQKTPLTLHTNFNAHQSISLFFGTDIAE